MNVIEIEKATLSTVPFDKLRYFSFAEGGAMGEPGGVLMVTSDQEVYHANHCFGDISYKDLEEVFPPIKKCHFMMLGLGSTAPNDWNYVDLGMGNHLIVHDDEYTEFKKKIKGLRPEQIYQKWLKFATQKKGKHTSKFSLVPSNKKQKMNIPTTQNRVSIDAFVAPKHKDKKMNIKTLENPPTKDRPVSFSRKLKELRKNVFIEISIWGELSNMPGTVGTIITKDNILYDYHDYAFIPEDMKGKMTKKGISEGIKLKKATIKKLNEYIEKNIVGKAFQFDRIIEDANYNVTIDYNTFLYQIDNYPDIYCDLVNIIEK